jgi:chromosome segregation ATPase
MTSCTSKISEEQMKQLQDLRRQEASLQEQIGRTRSDNTRLESEVRSRRAEVDLCNQEKQFVQSKLAQWPNIWPDYTPGETQQTTTPEND